MLNIVLMLNTMMILMKKNPKLHIDDHVRTSKHKNIFAKGYTLNWREEAFLIKKLKIQFQGLMFLLI